MDNSRAGGARVTDPDRSERDAERSKKIRARNPDPNSPEHYRESIKQITEKARKHGLQPRQRCEQEFAFRNRVNREVADLIAFESTCRRLHLTPRQPDEPFDDFRKRVTRADLVDRGHTEYEEPADARAQALKAAGLRD